MANPITSAMFKQIAQESINTVFDSEYEKMRLENFERWVKEVYPHIISEYQCVKDTGFDYDGI